MRFIIHGDPEDHIKNVLRELQAALDRRLPAYQPRASQVPRAHYVLVELDGALERPDPGTAGVDEEVVAAAEDAVPESVGILIWFEMSTTRSTLLFLRPSADDPAATGEAYLPPYDHL